MDKLKMHSPDLTQANIDKLAELFPNCVTEARDGQGRLKRAIDFDLLRQELSDHIVEGPQERYHLNWPGKAEALLAANAPIAKTLRPCREESVDFDTTRNLFIEGDNLEALKLLQETYLNQVKLIYIDPPYNTGREFIYDDDFKDDTGSYFVRSNQTDDEGRRLVANTDANGRYHSDWLTMIYPRLRLARNLLRDDGVIFISIDDNEVENLRKVCDEVFGEDNFIAAIVWQKRYVSNVTAKWVSDMHDYVLLYAKSKELVELSSWDRSDDQLAAYKNPDSDARGVWRAQDLSASKPYMAGMFEITGPTGRKFSPPPNRYWRCNEEQFNKWVADKRIWWGVNGDARPMLKSFLSESKRGITPHTWWDYKFAGHNKEATLELKKLFGGQSPFDTPKPVKLIQRILQLAGEPGENNIVLDFFSGSAVTAHAVLKQNFEDGGNRRFIAVQIPEALSKAEHKFNSIFEVGLARVRNYADEVREELTTKYTKYTKEEESDGGEQDFRVFRDFRGSNNDDSGTTTKSTKHTKEEENEGDEQDFRVFRDFRGSNNDDSGTTTKSTKHTKEEENEGGEQDFRVFRDFRGSIKPDLGFRVLRIDTSNMAEVYYNPDAITQDLLSDQIDNIREDRTPEDLLFQVLLDWGVDLSLPIRRVLFTQEEGTTKYTKHTKEENDEQDFRVFRDFRGSNKSFQVFFVDENALAACFDEGIDEAFIKELAQYKPLRVVFRDKGFVNDAVKINVEQLFKMLSPDTEVKTL